MSVSTSASASARWSSLYNQTPLSAVPAHYAGMSASPFLMEYLGAVLRLCPPGGRTLETGVGSGYGAVWLSERGLRAEGLDYSPEIVERARLVNSVLGGRAAFRVGDLFDLYAERSSSPQSSHHASSQSPSHQGRSSDHCRYSVIHHQGVLEHFTAPQVRAALAQQIARADWVVFSVPSVFYPFDPEFGDERLLPLEEWARLLAPFDVSELRYYGDPRLGGREHVLGVLRGVPAPPDLPNAGLPTPELLSLMRPGPEPYPAGISAVVHTRDEARHLGECLQTLAGWADEVIVCDMESTDATLEIAARYTDNIVRHPLIPNFDRARNVSAMRARYRWVFYLDADERVPPGLGPALRALTGPEDPGFEALLVPFRHHFAGHWMRCLYPGYTAPRLLRNGRFHFNARLHSGAQVDGRVRLFPAEDVNLSLEHFSFDSLSHYLGKLNRYTDGEAADLHRDGRVFGWREAVGHFVSDFQAYYDRGGAAQDGVHGFLYAFLSGFYRFEQHAKLYELRHRHGQLTPPETAVPGDVAEVLEYALSVARRRPPAVAADVRVEAGGAGSVWSGPLWDASGYGEESRHLLLALDDALESQSALENRESSEGGNVPGAGAARQDCGDEGPTRPQESDAQESDALQEPARPRERVAAQALPWGERAAGVGEPARSRLTALTGRAASPGFVQVCHTLAPLFRRHPSAGAAVGRTMFETDRLPADWVRACNGMDAVWVPTEFNRRTFADAGVEQSKLAVVPGCLDPGPYREARLRRGDPSARAGLPPAAREAMESGSFVFLSVFDWTLHKGWDVLLRAFLAEFPSEPETSVSSGGPGVRLLLKVWSSLGHGEAGVRAQAGELARAEFGLDLSADGRVGFVFEHLDAAGMAGLYGASDAYVLASRGEGWGRPYLEAMACGLPAIGTGWSGNTAFMTGENSYLVDCDLAGVPAAGWGEVAAYRGHRWAEPRVSHLREQLRRVFAERGEAEARGRLAREEVSERFGPGAVGPQVAAALRQVRETFAPHPIMAPLPMTAPVDVPLNPAASPEAQTHSASLPDPLPQVAPVPLPDPVRVRWEGAQFSWHSLAHVNRELCLGLLADPGAELSVLPTEAPQFGPAEEPRVAGLASRSFAPLSGPAHAHVRHAFPPRLDPPDEGHLVLVQPWEYGTLPREWVAPILANVSEVWCYSEYVRGVYRDSGVPEERLKILPLGVDEKVFRPDVPPYVFTTEAGAAEMAAGNPALPDLSGRFVFLFAGGTVARKGADVLLATYLRAFGPDDPVALVVKDTGTRTVYRGQNEAARIRGLIADPSRPRIVYLDDDLPAAALAGVYRAAHCLVQPYRGEGFCLPALEAMACGVPVVAPLGGPTDDFVDAGVGWRVGAARVPVAGGRVGPWECVEPPWGFEVDPGELARLLREIQKDPALARRKGEAASARVASGWTWGHSAAVLAGLLRDLRGRPVPVRARPAPAVTVPPVLIQASPASLPAEAAPPERMETGGQVGSSSLPNPSSPAISTSPTISPFPTISLCMIVRDEERVLGDCLASARPFVDEIVVVDTGSTDRTVEVARSHGARVEHFAWCEDFAAARNASLSYAAGDWVLWMDADDTLPEECGRRLRELAGRAAPGTLGILMQVRIPPGPGEAGLTVVDHVKLIRNGRGLRFEGRIHEQILEPIYRAGGGVERSDLYVVHSGYDRSEAGQAKKRARDRRLLALDLSERPDHPFVLFNVGMTAYHTGEFAEARGALERCLALSRPQESTVRKVYAMLSGCALAEGDVAGAVCRVEQGLSLYPRDPELLFRAGIAYHRAGRLEAAASSYRRLLSEREEGHIDSLDVSMAGFKAHHNLALVCQDLGAWGEAEGEWKAAVGCEPGFVPSWAGLAELYLMQGRLAEALAVAARLAPLDPALAEGIRRRAMLIGDPPSGERPGRDRVSADVY